MRFQLTARTGHPDFLDLPWDEPLSSWEHDRLVEMPMGIHRHVVRTVRYRDRLYHLKELPRRYAEREWRFLRHLTQEGVPCVCVVGVVSRRDTPDGDRLDAVLITEHLEFSVPYRLLFLRQEHRTLRDPMLDALVHLLVRLHINGFLWGDCSLSNTLFRRDAGALSAYVVDTETGELHDELTRGQRQMDIDLAIEKCAGELMDLQVSGVLSPNVDPGELGQELQERYDRLWAELTTDEVFRADERYKMHDRLRRINDLGYDVDELELVQDEPGLTRMRLKTCVLEPGRWRRLLRERTGLDVQDNQAARLLSDIQNFGAWLQKEEGRELSDEVVAHRWLEQSFQPTVALVPHELRGRREPAEIFHEVLEHWNRLSAEEGADIELFDGARHYVDHVLRALPDERVLTSSSDDGDEDLAGYLPDPLADTGRLRAIVPDAGAPPAAGAVGFAESDEEPPQDR